nr:receptor-like protein 12 [Tanacetum cinerariifolium]
MIIETGFQIAWWNTSVDCCQWGGVTCDKSGHLIGLDLSYESIKGGTLSDSIGGLKWLSRMELRSCGLSGPIPSSMQNLMRLEYPDLSANLFTGSILSFHESIDVSCYQLQTIDLSSNKFDGPIPEFIFKLPLLSNLMLSANNCTGIVDLDTFGAFKELYTLELSFNDLTFIVNANNSSFSSLFRLNSLNRASWQLKEFPDLKNQSRMMMLDLSVNELTGEIPNWIWEVRNGYLRSLNLSHNKLSSLQKPYTFPFLFDILDLHSNYLQGDIPIPSKGSYILDYSNHNFGSSIPVDFCNFLTSALFFSIKNSTMVGPFPRSICNASSLVVLDLSHDSLSRTVPSCLAETSKTPQVLNLGKNNLSGNVLDLFPDSVLPPKLFACFQAVTHKEAEVNYLHYVHPGLHNPWGTRLKFSPTFQPQTNGQTERTIQTLKNMSRPCTLEWMGNWDKYSFLAQDQAGEEGEGQGNLMAHFDDRHKVSPSYKLFIKDEKKRYNLRTSTHIREGFTLFEIFNSNNIQELNHCRERTLDPQEVLTNVKGWKIVKQRRIENYGNGRVDKMYHHPKCKKVRRSLNEVRKFIEENSYLRSA